MRINKQTDSALFDMYKNYCDYSKGNKNTRKDIIRDIFQYNPYFFEAAVKFCEKNGIEYSSESEAVFNYYPSFITAWAVFFGQFNVDYICESFYKPVYDNRKKLSGSLDGQGLYEAFGKRAGYLVFGTKIVCYSFTENLSTIFWSERNQYLFKGIIDDENNVAIMRRNETLDCQDVDTLETALAILILETSGDVTTQTIAGNTRRPLIDNSKEMLLNQSPFPIRQIDNTFLKTLIRTEGFLVRGFFRRQPCGVGRKERRLTYIKPFKKHGYTRRAKKLIYEESSASYAYAS